MQVVGTLYTHHQKCVLVDTPASESTRRITAFLGGLDLCAGRYDTPSHRLFRDLDTVFHGDVYNPLFGVRREPLKTSSRLMMSLSMTIDHAIVLFVGGHQGPAPAMARPALPAGRAGGVRRPQEL